jgi:hypothetical protein
LLKFHSYLKILHRPRETLMLKNVRIVCTFKLLFHYFPVFIAKLFTVVISILLSSIQQFHNKKFIWILNDFSQVDEWNSINLINILFHNFFCTRQSTKKLVENWKSKLNEAFPRIFFLHYWVLIYRSRISIQKLICLVGIFRDHKTVISIFLQMVSQNEIKYSKNLFQFI